MFEMRLDSLIQSIVRSNLSQNIKEGQAMYIHFNASLYDFDQSNRDGNEISVGLHLLYSCLPKRNCITVFSGVSPDSFRGIKEVKSWKHEVTHDSCWTDISVLNDTFFSMAKTLNDRRVGWGLPIKAPNQFSQNVTFPLSDKLWEWVDVKITKNPTDVHHYQKCVEVL